VFYLKELLILMQAMTTPHHYWNSW